jgi:hypothetical protein
MNWSRQLLAEMTPAERQQEQRKRLHEIGRELSGAYARQAAIEALIRELSHERVQIESELRRKPPLER